MVGLFVLPTLDEVTGRLGKDEHATGEDSSPDELKSDSNTVGGVVGAVLGAIVDDGSKEEADGNSPLVASDDGTTNPLGRTVGK